MCVSVRVSVGLCVLCMGDMYARTCVYRLETTSAVFLNFSLGFFHLLLYFKMRSLPGTGAHQFGEASWPATSRDFLPLLPQVSDFKCVLSPCLTFLNVCVGT